MCTKVLNEQNRRTILSPPSSNHIVHFNDYSFKPFLLKSAKHFKARCIFCTLVIGWVISIFSGCGEYGKSGSMRGVSFCLGGFVSC